MKHLGFSVAMLLLVGAAPLEAASMEGPGVLPEGSAWGVSADGSVVVGNAGGGAFRWTATEGVVGLGELFPGGSGPWAEAVSADGSVVVGWEEGWAFRWTAETGMVALCPGLAHGASADGSVVVGRSGREAFRWTEETGIVGLGFLPGHDYSKAYDVSADGSVVVGRSRLGSGGDDAFVWTADEGMTNLGARVAWAVSADGSIVVGDPAFLWTAESGMIRLVDPLGSFRVCDVSADGSLVVGSSSNHIGLNRASVWDSTHGVRSLGAMLVDDFGLDLTRWTHLEEATGISADGRIIVGYGSYLNGPRQAWRAVIPEPSPLTLLGVGSVVFLWASWGQAVRSQ